MERLRSRSDVLLGVGLCLIAVAELGTGSAHARAASFAILPFATLPLALRRRAPLAVLVAVLAANLAHVALVGNPLPALGDPPNSFALAVAFLVAVYSVAACSAPRESVVGLVLACAAIGAFTATAPGPTTINDFLAASLFSVVVPWLVGVVRARQRRVDEERTRRAETEQRRERDVRAAIETERTRIARELHDIVAHSLGVIVVQASAERRGLEGSAHDETRDVLAIIERTGRSALGELRRLLGILRTSEGVELVPQPGVEDIADVVATIRDAGIDAQLRVEGAQRALPPGVSLSAYRVVQESLTNVVKHAAATKASITLSYAPDALVVEVADNGVSAQSAAEPSGFGLVGMAERVSLFGGELDYGTGGDGKGFRVVAKFPVGTA